MLTQDSKISIAKNANGMLIAEFSRFLKGYPDEKKIIGRKISADEGRNLLINAFKTVLETLKNNDGSFLTDRELRSVLMNTKKFWGFRRFSSSQEALFNLTFLAAETGLKGQGTTVKANEDNKEALTAYTRGYAFEHVKQYENAIGEYNKAIQFNPQYAEAYFQLGYVYFTIGLSSSDSNDAPKLMKGLANIAHAVELDPNFNKADKAKDILKFTGGDRDCGHGGACRTG